MGDSGFAYLAAFGASVGLTLVFTPVALRVARRRRILDMPHAHKSHESPVPYLGGLAIVLAFSLALMVAAVIQAPPSGLSDLAVILSLGVLLSIVGLVDDLRGLSRLVRVGAEVAAGIVLWWIGSGVGLFTGSDELNALATVLWVVGVTNAFNLLDNMDGLSAGVAALCASAFFVIAALNGQVLVGALAIALAGCALGFLRHNIHPAKIYMGDAGSLFLGFMLAVIGMRLRLPNPEGATYLIPIVVLGTAIFDTTLVSTGRLMHGRSPFLGGRDHISHRLVFVGIPVPVAVALIYGGTIALGWLAIVMTRIDTGSAYLLMGFIVAVGVFLAVLLGSVPVYENSKRRQFMIQEVKKHEPEAGT